jgi:hypothetical protein
VPQTQSNLRSIELPLLSLDNQTLRKIVRVTGGSRVRVVLSKNSERLRWPSAQQPRPPRQDTKIATNTN